MGVLGARPEPAGVPRRVASGGPRLALVGQAHRGPILVGTAATVRQLARQLALAPSLGRPLGCVLIEGADGDPELPVLGTVDQLGSLEALSRATGVVVSLPAALGHLEGRIATALRGTQLPVRFLPALEELFDRAEADGDTPPESLAPVVPGRVDLAWLIGRRPRQIDQEALRGLVCDRRVLITGAGGSIGSELARLAAACSPTELLLVERAENALFEIDRRLGELAPGVRRRALLHDVVDSEATGRLLATLRPELVFHAAAHKHVPLMEDHPAHALSNNLFGTRSVARAALACGARRFVLISTDKAVQPASIMGATKRLAELYVHGLHAQAYRQGAPTRFAMVRFGNVLGSACSVLAIWSSQLAQGGPITVTDARMTRYFMTIEEAARLVMLSAAIDPEPTDRAGVYVLDMGRPVRVLALARRFVRAHGFRPRIVPTGTVRRRRATSAGLDPRPAMDIVLTGARAGEKIHEQLASAGESLEASDWPGILICRGGFDRPIDPEAMAAELEPLCRCADRGAVVDAIARYAGGPARTGQADLAGTPAEGIPCAGAVGHGA